MHLRVWTVDLYYSVDLSTICNGVFYSTVLKSTNTRLLKDIPLCSSKFLFS